MPIPENPLAKPVCKGVHLKRTCRSYNITGLKAEVGLSHVVQESKAKKQRNRSLCMTIVLSVSSVIVQLCRHISMLYPSFSFHLYNVCRCCMRLNCCVNTL